ncbi:MAG: T9SS type A sorting domain-containing protein [Bacteroidota bacterium]|nr:T9SS type A sorting domain-containing protein [Bacteroidota bacterium]
MSALITKQTEQAMKRAHPCFLFLVSIGIFLFWLQPESVAQTRIILISSSSGFAESSGDKVTVMSVLGDPLSGSASGGKVFLNSGLSAFVQGQELISAVKNSDGPVPTIFSLSQNYPNPFNPTTALRFTVPKNGRVTLMIYNIIGQKVATLFDEIADAGKYHRVQFDASRLASGVYFARLTFGDNVLLKKMLLIK